jgi:tetratricopeptide (TPR) repeat protein
MKPSTELFDLIKSLSKSEKRFFKLSSSLQTGEKNYLKIFDAIDKQTEYDEAAVKHHFRKETFIKHFPSEKNHLYKLILKSLRAYHADNSVSSVLKQEIKNIEILYNKALFKECNKFLMRAKKMAIQHEKFYFLFELISWEKSLLEEALEDGQFTKDLDTLIKEEQEVIEKLRNLAAYHVLYSKINYVFRSGGFVRNEEDRQLVEEIKNHPLIKGKNTALSHRAATICYYTQGFCNLANGDLETAYTKFAKVKSILDTNQNIRQDLAKRYARTLNNMITCQIDKGNYDAAAELTQELKSMSRAKGFNSTDIQVEIFKDTSIAELKICHYTGDFTRGLAMVDTIVSEMEELEGKLHKEQVLTFYYQIAYIYFGAGEYNKSLFWINKVLNDNENTLRQDIYSYARLFNLVIHFELGNYDLLEYISKSTQRYLSKRQRDYNLEKLVIEYVRKLIRTNSNLDRRDLFVSFRSALDEVMMSQEERIVLKYFNFIKWADSKIENATFAETMRKAI